MELRHLRYFVAVAEEGSVTAAARRVAVAQPSLSRQLRQLETELGVRLFDRTGRSLSLSASGAAFLPMARDLVTRADRAAAAMGRLGGADAPPLTVAAPETTVADVIAPFLAARGGDLPAINVREALPAAVFEEVASGSADLGVSSGAAPAALATRPIASYPILAYVPVGHRWARRARIGIAELVGEPLVVLSPAHGTRRMLDGAIAEAGLSYRQAAETNVPQVAQALAAGGRGVAVVSDDPRYGLRPVGLQGARGPLRIRLVAAWDPSHYAAASLAEVAEALAGWATSAGGLSAEAPPGTGAPSGGAP